MTTLSRAMLCMVVLNPGAFAANEVFVTGQDASSNYKTYSFTTTGSYMNETSPSSSKVTSATTDGVHVLVGTHSTLDVLIYNTSNVNIGTFVTVAAASMGSVGPIAINQIEVDAAGNVYICPTGYSSNPRTSLRYTSGALLSESFSDSTLVFPSGIDADASGNVYIVNSTGAGVDNVIFKFRSNGTLVGSTDINSVISKASDMAIDEANKVLYVGDYFGGSYAIAKFDISGTLPIYVDRVNTPGMLGAAGLSFDPSTGNLLIADYSGDGIEITPSGTLVRSFSGGSLDRSRDIVRIASQSTTVPVELSAFSTK